MTLNQCCMAFRAIWLSDICTGSGEEVTKAVREGGDPVESHVAYLHPYVNSRLEVLAMDIATLFRS